MIHLGARVHAFINGLFRPSDEALTRESLTLLTGTLRAQLAEVLAAAKHADTEEAWRQRVVTPLRVTVGDLVGGIECRQRALDSQQEEVQSEISKLLQVEGRAAARYQATHGSGGRSRSRRS